MSYRLVKLEHTDDLDEAFRAKVGALFIYYLYKDSEVTHLCELAPSYWLEPISFETGRRLSDDDHFALLRELGEWGQYRHCRDMDRFKTIPAIDDDELLEDELIEYYKSNPPGF